jgi:hypothetical protein
MDDRRLLDQIIMIYKCVMLTAIALILLLLYLKTPNQFTIKNIQTKKVQLEDVPLVRVMGGNLNVDVSNVPLEVEVTNTR